MKKILLLILFPKQIIFNHLFYLIKRKKCPDLRPILLTTKNVFLTIFEHKFSYEFLIRLFYGEEQTKKNSMNSFLQIIILKYFQHFLSGRGFVLTEVKVDSRKLRFFYLKSIFFVIGNLELVFFIDGLLHFGSLVTSNPCSSLMNYCIYWCKPTKIFLKNFRKIF